jgi:pimeloyl-ACP methyl ester carboxylesterase
MTGQDERMLEHLESHDDTIHFETHGQGPAILLTHGFGATCRMWDEQIEEFTDRYRLIPWDIPGHGGSRFPLKPICGGDLIEDMAAVLDAAGEERAVLIGLGAGGLLSLRFWHRYPARVRGMILIGTTPGLRGTLVRGIVNERAEMQAAALERYGLDALEGGAEADPRLHADASDLAAAARLLLTQTDEGALLWLSKVDVPVLILTGGEDRPNLTAAEHMARMIPNALKVCVPRANHAANMHKPDAVNAAIRPFLGKLPP